MKFEIEFVQTHTNTIEMKSYDDNERKDADIPNATNNINVQLRIFDIELEMNHCDESCAEQEPLHLVICE